MYLADGEEDVFLCLLTLIHLLFEVINLGLQLLSLLTSHCHLIQVRNLGGRRGGCEGGEGGPEEREVKELYQCSFFCTPPTFFSFSFMSARSLTDWWYALFVFCTVDSRMSHTYCLGVGKERDKCFLQRELQL